MSAETTAAAGSPLERARRRYQQNQQEDYLHLDVPRWGDDLVMRIGLPSDEGAASAISSLLALTSGGQLPSASPDQLADALASAVVCLCSRGYDGTLEPLNAPDTGQPLRFDHAFGPAIGVPECSTPRAAVLLAFTSGEPPMVNTGALAMVATSVVMWLAGATERAEQTVTGS
jgi:hypothetical protein